VLPVPLSPVALDVVLLLVGFAVMFDVAFGVGVDGVSSLPIENKLF
jgi:hypothetical protein